MKTWLTVYAWIAIMGGLAALGAWLSDRPSGPELRAQARQLHSAHGNAMATSPEYREIIEALGRDEGALDVDGYDDFEYRGPAPAPIAGERIPSTFLPIRWAD